MNNIIVNDMSSEDFNFILNRLLIDFDEFWSVQNFKSEYENQNSKCIVAKIDSEIAGFASIWKAVDVYHITNIVTHKNFREKGVATALLEQIISICKTDKSITAITLEVNEKNLPAKKLYEKFAFSKVGIRKKYYNGINDAIIMTREVNK